MTAHTDAPVIPERLDKRPPCSLPMDDADVRLDNYNWQKGLQAESDWIWSGNLNPELFPNNLARFLLHIPGVFEQQLNYSTTLIFDEPSFRNGNQMSGFVPRVVRELCITFIAQHRRCRYSMTHHAVLGTLTARKHHLSEDEIGEKWSNVLSSSTTAENGAAIYTRLERAVLAFARAFSTDPKRYSDNDYAELRAAFFEHNREAYAEEIRWLDSLRAARAASATARAKGKDADEVAAAGQRASQNVAPAFDDDANDARVDAQVVELGFICLQFIALTGIFSGLNVPDEGFLADVVRQVVPAPVQARMAEILSGTTDGMDRLIPAAVALPLHEILLGRLTVESTTPRGTRIPLVSWEQDPTQGTRDKGLALGGVHVGVYGWSFGSYFPGSLTYALMHHPELARYEAPYSLPVLFNEDEWRNGTQTSGFNRPPVKELAIQKVYHLVRARYGLEHHIMFFYNAVLQERGTGPFRSAGMSDDEHARALASALATAESLALNLVDHRSAPDGTYSELQSAMLDWIEALLTTPHAAHRFEGRLRDALRASNIAEIHAATRRLDHAGGFNDDGALARLVNHQIAELAMVVCHMDGLGRLLTILQLESELAVSSISLEATPSQQMTLQRTGAMNDRPALLDLLRFTGVSSKVLTHNELLVNPALAQELRDRLAGGAAGPLHVSAAAGMKTAEF